MRPQTKLVSVLAAGTALLAVNSAWSQEQPKPTVKDRLDAVVSTVTGSPMADLDVDMKHVLDSLKKLDPKPIPGLSPHEARKQPTPTDGVKELLKERGKTQDDRA